MPRISPRSPSPDCVTETPCMGDGAGELSFDVYQQGLEPSFRAAALPRPERIARSKGTLLRVLFSLPGALCVSAIPGAERRAPPRNTVPVRGSAQRIILNSDFSALPDRQGTALFHDASAPIGPLHSMQASPRQSGKVLANHSTLLGVWRSLGPSGSAARLPSPVQTSQVPPPPYPRTGRHV